MINLIYNEIYKIFKRRITIIFVLFIVLQFLFISLIGKYYLYNLEHEDEIRIQSINKKYSKDSDNVVKTSGEYIEDMNFKDLYNLNKEYPKKSWQRYILTEDGTPYINCINLSKYKNHNEETLKECETKLDELVNKVKRITWQDYIIEKQDTALENLDKLKSEYDEETDELEKEDIYRSMQAVMFEIDGYKYHLDKKIPIDYTDNSVMIDEYVSLAIGHINIEEDESKYQNYYNLMEKRIDEDNMYSYKYRIENNLDSISQNSANKIFRDYVCTAIPIVIVYMLLISSSIIVDEFNKGTIKQLLIRPYTRRKILISKLLACIICTLLFILLYQLVAFIFIGITYGFKSYSIPIILYDFNTKNIVKMSIIKYMLINTATFIPEYLMLLLFTIFVGILLTNEALAVGIPFVILIVSSYLPTTNIKILKYFPTVCWNLNEFLWGGLPSLRGLELLPSLIVCIVTIIIVFFGCLSSFKNKEINNQ